MNMVQCQAEALRDYMLKGGDAERWFRSKGFTKKETRAIRAQLVLDANRIGTERAHAWHTLNKGRKLQGALLQMPGEAANEFA